MLPRVKPRHPISTRSARGGGDWEESKAAHVASISTRSARGGGDITSLIAGRAASNFNPLRPWGRRRGRRRYICGVVLISTRSARGGGDFRLIH